MPSSFRKLSKLDPVRLFNLVMMIFPILVACQRQRNIFTWRALILFDETVQQKHEVILNRKQHACNARLECSANFPERSAQMIDLWFTNWPLVLNISNVFTDLLPILLGQL